LIVFVVGLVAGAVLALAAYRAIARARIAQAKLEADGQARADAAAARARTEEVRAQLADAQRRLAAAESTIANRDASLAQAHHEIAQHLAERATFDARTEEMGRIAAQAREAFQALSHQALRDNNATFMQLAQAEMQKLREGSQADLDTKKEAIGATLDTIRHDLVAYEAKLQLLEQDRTRSATQLATQIEQFAKTSESLRSETASLGGALRSSQVRGMWGELTLRRCCELAGMVEYCDFQTQESIETEDGGTVRPDLVVQLPGGKTVAVDAKVPFTAYLEAMNCEDEAKRSELLQEYATALRRHIENLSGKSYWKHLERTLDLVVLFLPAESLLGAALASDPALLQEALAQRIIVATPTTLIGLLKAIECGWRGERLAEHAEQIRTLGCELHERLVRLTDRFEKVGSHLGKSVTAYNEAVGCLESRVLVSARRFEELGAASGDGIGELKQIEVVPRSVAVPAASDGQRSRPALVRA
jgi:DNA recombination protein RmuC